MNDSRIEEARKRLWELHKGLAEHFLDQLQNPPEGGIKGSTLDTMRQFLKDNLVSLKHSQLVKGDAPGMSNEEYNLRDLVNLEDPQQAELEKSVEEHAEEKKKKPPEFRILH